MSYITANIPSPPTSDLVPARDFPNSASKTLLKVGLVGDSTSTDEPNFTATEHAALNGILRHKLVTSNRDRTFKFYDLGIGATLFSDFWDGRWPNLAAVYDPEQGAAATPNWVSALETETGLSASTSTWWDFMVALDLDILFVKFGMNDGRTTSGEPVMVASQWDAVLRDMRLLLPNTDVCLITNNLNIGVGGTAADRELDRLGRLMPQLWTRSAAIYDGYGLIDIGRQFCRSVLGFDPRRTTLVRKLNGVSKAFPIVDLAACHQDFNLKMVFDHSVFDTTSIKITTSQKGANAESWLEIDKDGDKVRLQHRTTTSDTSGRSLNLTSSLDMPTTGDITLEMDVRDTMVSVSVNGTEIVAKDADGNDLFGQNILSVIRGGGIFSPKVTRGDGGALTATVTYWAGEFIRENPVISPAEAYEDGVTGNDQNHLSHKGTQVVVVPTLDAIDFTLPPIKPVSGTLEDMTEDTVRTITLPSNLSDGVFTIISSRTGLYARVPFSAGETPELKVPAELGSIVTATTATNLTGSTGTDNRVNISIRTGEIQVESRLLAQVSIDYWIDSAVR